MVASPAAPLSKHSEAQTKLVTPLGDNGSSYHLPLTVGYFELQHGLKKIKEIMKRKAKDGDVEELIIIDAIQRLGLDYYFHDEIHDAMQRNYANLCRISAHEKINNLHEVALRFRLSRQHGFNSPADIFSGLKANDGKLKEEFHKDMKGLFSLYEASQLSIRNEGLLDEARRISIQFLNLHSNMEQPNKEIIIKRMLENPFHRSSARILARSFLQDFDMSVRVLHDIDYSKNWIKCLQDLAMVESNVTQWLRKYELLQIFEWGEKLNSNKELNFVRIEPMKWYIWSLGTLPWPNMAEERIALAKLGSLIYIIDDIFDVHGVLVELSLFATAVNRWEEADVEKLPNSMKVCFKALIDVVNYFSNRTLIKHGWNPKYSLQKSWADLCNSFLMEAKWLSSRELPSSQEYLKNGILSSGIPVALIHTFFLLGERVNRESVQALDSLPPIIYSTATIARLSNDIGIDQDENRDGIDGSYIDCYIKEHNHSSLETAKQEVSRMISDAWKRLNEELLSSTSPFSSNFKAACLNFARMSQLVYGRDKHHHLLSLGKQLSKLLDESLI